MSPRADEKKAGATPVIVATRKPKGGATASFAAPAGMPVREPGNDWVCTISERVGRQAPRAIVNARGIDSVQALLVAFIALRKVLAKDDHKLTWLGEPGALGLPLVTLDDDPEFFVPFVMSQSVSTSLLVRRELRRARSCCAEVREQAAVQEGVEKAEENGEIRGSPGESSRKTSVRPVRGKDLRRHEDQAVDEGPE
ncbi:MAG: hypothetical protein IPG04_32725, partial [Polyangiaceae bacterium]|nr:hypothetical protein [Polyangiaceae bacterium]